MPAVLQNAGVADIDGMIGANSVAVSPDGKFVYVSSGGYYRGKHAANHAQHTSPACLPAFSWLRHSGSRRHLSCVCVRERETHHTTLLTQPPKYTPTTDHHLLVFKRQPDGPDKGRLALLQNIDIYNTSASRVLPSTLAVAPDGKNVYVVGANFAISTSAILVYRCVDACHAFVHAWMSACGWVHSYTHSCVSPHRPFPLSPFLPPRTTQYPHYSPPTASTPPRGG